MRHVISPEIEAVLVVLYIPELGLYYYKARFYNASLGRFMQADPVYYADDVNLYAYVGNDPLNKNDFLGLRPSDLDPQTSEELRRRLEEEKRRQDEEREKKIQDGSWTEFDEASYQATIEALDAEIAKVLPPVQKVNSKGEVVNAGSAADDAPDEADEQARDGDIEVSGDSATYFEDQRKKFEELSTNARASGDEKARVSHWAQACVMAIRYYAAQGAAVSASMCSKL